MIAFLEILTVLYLISFIFVFYSFMGNKNQEMNQMFGVTKGDVYGIFFIFPFVAIGIFILELLNAISFLFTKKLFFQQPFFEKFKQNLKVKAEKEKEKRKKHNQLTEEQEKLFKSKLNEIQKEIQKQRKIIEQL